MYCKTAREENAMKDVEQPWSLAQEAMQAFGPFYREAMTAAIQATGAPNEWYALNLARGAHPAPFTLERFHALVPYSARERLAETLETLARLELLEPVGENAYRLTGQGLEAAEQPFQAAHEKLAAVKPLPAADMARLNGLLFRLVKATLEAPEPKDKWAIAYSRWTDPGKGAAPSVLTDQYLTDLVRYRDDAHVAAFKPYGVGGQAWEALTFVWRGDARTAAQLAEKLPFRGHSAESYAGALADLSARGWVKQTPEGYAATKKGAAMRREAEDTTNRLFFAPWACLSDVESVELRDLLTRLRDALQTMAGSE
jgi:hypothetical protein